jgi:L-lactate permease
MTQTTNIFHQLPTHPIIAIHNVVAASTVVGLAHREGLIMRRLIMATMGYVGMAVVIGLACAALL